jgi:hypothetical protein
MNAPAVSIIDTLDDPALFQRWFEGPSWNAWRVILKAAFWIPLDDTELETFHTLAGDRAPPERQVKELWIIAGRRAGKDSIASAIAAQSPASFAVMSGRSFRRRRRQKKHDVSSRPDQGQQAIGMKLA